MKVTHAPDPSISLQRECAKYDHPETSKDSTAMHWTVNPSLVSHVKGKSCTFSVHRWEDCYYCNATCASSLWLLQEDMVHLLQRQPRLLISLPSCALTAYCSSRLPSAQRHCQCLLSLPLLPQCKAGCYSESRVSENIKHSQVSHLELTTLWFQLQRVPKKLVFILRDIYFFFFF